MLYLCVVIIKQVMETINIQLMAHINGCLDDTPAKHIVPTSMNLVGSMIVKKCGDKWSIGICWGDSSCGRQA